MQYILLYDFIRKTQENGYDRMLFKSRTYLLDRESDFFRMFAFQDKALLVRRVEPHEIGTADPETMYVMIAQKNGYFEAIRCTKHTFPKTVFQLDSEGVERLESGREESI